MKKDILFLVVAIIAIFSLQYSFSKIDAKKALSSQEYALYKAAYMGRTKKVKRLVEKGVNVNIKSPNSQRTPLHIAASKGRFEIVQALVDHGANLKVTNKEHKTPLDFAVEKNRTEIVKYLLEHGAIATPETIENAKNEEIKALLKVRKKHLP